MRKVVYSLIGILVGVLFAIILITNTSKVKSELFDSNVIVNDNEVSLTDNSFITEKIHQVESFITSLEDKEGYFVNNKKLMNYANSKVIAYGRGNPMLYSMLEILIEEDELEDINLEIGDTEDFVTSDGMSIGYNVAEKDLVVVDVKEIESILRNNSFIPVDNKYYGVTSKFGIRTDPIDKKETKFHVGLDIAKAGINGQRIYAISDGEVESISSGGSYGNYIVINHGAFNSVYAHMEGIGRGIKEGKTIKAGDVIGYVGSTGRSTGPHLHFEIEKDGIKLNPEYFISIINGKSLGDDIDKIIETVVDDIKEDNTEDNIGGGD